MSIKQILAEKFVCHAGKTKNYLHHHQPVFKRLRQGNSFSFARDSLSENLLAALSTVVVAILVR